MQVELIGDGDERTPMIQMTQQGLAFTGTDSDTESLRRYFERDHFPTAEKLSSSDIISLIRPFLERAEYSPAQYKRVGSELRMEPNLAFDTLSFLANDKKLFTLVQAITGCGPIGYFQGRVYKLVSGPAAQL